MLRQPRSRNVEHRLRQDQAVGRDHQQVGRRFDQRHMGGRVSQPLRLMHRNTVRQRHLLDRAGDEFLPATGRPVGLAQHEGNFEAGGKQGPQRDGGEFRRTREGNFHTKVITP